MTTSAECDLNELKRTVETYWGFSSLRPLQEEAISIILDKQDSLVVLPTGGGKSLCYQAPAVATNRLTIVVSPLISLMKDQVDALTACGIAATQINSSQVPEERLKAIEEMLNGKVKLVFVSPERLVGEDFTELLRRTDVETFAIDEAHCISHWGHDFRPEYRQLRQLKYLFPQASVHAFTATATEEVRKDIISQLGLTDPAVLVGDFDRPNLTYRIVPRQDTFKQVQAVLARHPGESGIIYCISRKQVDSLVEKLQQQGVRALPYHAGLESEARRRTHEAFAEERCDVVVATIAFGMGINRSNVRFVLHIGMPKSLEHYQQETGRAGRDGLEAECTLLYSFSDVLLWRSIIQKAQEAGQEDSSYAENALRHVEEISKYCRGLACRHAALVRYFGQDYSAANCNSCDVCLSEIECLEDSDVIAQKILSCVARVKEGFGVGHIISVLRGENTEGVRRFEHQTLSTYGLLKDVSKNAIRDWIHQLISQEALTQVDKELREGFRVPLLKLNKQSWEVLRGQRSVSLNRPVAKVQKSVADVQSWAGVDKQLFEHLKTLRRTLASERGCAPYIIAHDTTLRELSKQRPNSMEELLEIHGIGKAKAKEYGEFFLSSIREFQQAT
ncbi:MAG: DNA helicase RecQ [Cyanobacteria bacterium]|nr:DNA helicase RecQ [Cyanobacteriota bacterium]